MSAGWELFEKKVGDDHTVLRLLDGDRARAEREEVMRGVDLVEAKQRDAAMIGVSPASADGAKGVGEVLL